MDYYQCIQERQNLLNKKALTRESFSSSELYLSGNSSISGASSSASGSSGFDCALDTPDSPASTASVRLFSLDDTSRKLTFKYSIAKSDKHPCATKLITPRSKHRSERNSLPPTTGELHNYLSHGNQANMKMKTAEWKTIPSFPERSNSESELLSPRSNLSSPEGLIISTPPAKGAHFSSSEKRSRVRSKSESYGKNNSPKIEIHSKVGGNNNCKREKQQGTTAVDCGFDEDTMKQCIALMDTTCDRRKGRTVKDASKLIAILESQLDQVCQERDGALRERNEMMHDRDRIKCERDAIELERDNLLHDKERLERELINRNNVIDHLREHLGLAFIPVKLTTRTLSYPATVQARKEISTTYEDDAPSGRKFKTRPRSKSEIKTSEFYFPDQVLKTNAYTCL